MTLNGMVLLGKSLWKVEIALKGILNNSLRKLSRGCDTYVSVNDICKVLSCCFDGETKFRKSMGEVE